MDSNEGRCQPGGCTDKFWELGVFWCYWQISRTSEKTGNKTDCKGMDVSLNMPLTKFHVSVSFVCGYAILLCFLLSSPYIFVTLLFWHIAQISVYYHEFMYTPCPDEGSNPGPLDCKSEALPTELCGPLDRTTFNDVYKHNDVSNDIILMIISLSVT